MNAMRGVFVVPIYLSGCWGRFQGLKISLDNQYLMDKDAYPTTMPQAPKLLESIMLRSALLRRMQTLLVSLELNFLRLMPGN